MPEGTIVVSAKKSGISAWTRTAEVLVILADGSSKSYFLKVHIVFLQYMTLS